MDELARSIGKIPQLVRWFFTAIVIPLSIWFLALRSDVNALSIKQVNTQSAVKRIEAASVSHNEMVVRKLTEFERSLGRIEGEIKRIK
jgi:hypothetical protein